MQTERNKTSYTAYIPMIVMGIAGFLLTYFNEWYADPIDYKFIEVDTADGIPDTYVRNLRDIWVSQCNHYLFSNGRFFVHFITQIFCGLLPQWVFAVCNGIVWFFLPYMTLRLLRLRPTLASATTASILLFLLFITVRYDPPFQLNYSWSALLFIGFIMVYFSSGKHTPVMLVLTALLAFACGESNESFSLPLSAAVIVHAIYKRFRLTPQQWVASVFLGIGCIVLIIAPGNWLRISQLTPNNQFSAPLAEAMIPALPIPLLAACALWAHRKSLKLFDTPKKRFIALIFLTNYSILIIIGLCSGPRTIIAGGLCLIFMMIYLLNKHSYSKAANIAGTAICLIVLSLVMLNNQADSERERFIYRTIAKSTDGNVYLPDSVFADNYYRLRYCRKQLKMECSVKFPQLEEVHLRPEVLRRYADKDTNMLVQIAPQAWIMVRSKQNPAKFSVDKILLPRLINRPMSRKEFDFTLPYSVHFESTPVSDFGIYVNQRPYIEANVIMK